MNRKQQYEDSAKSLKRHQRLSTWDATKLKKRKEKLTIQQSSQFEHLFGIMKMCEAQAYSCSLLFIALHEVPQGSILRPYCIC